MATNYLELLWHIFAVFFRTGLAFLVKNSLELVWPNFCGIPLELDIRFRDKLLGIRVASFLRYSFRTGPTSFGDELLGITVEYFWVRYSSRTEPTFLVTNYLELMWYIFCGIPLELDPRFW